MGTGVRNKTENKISRVHRVIRDFSFYVWDQTEFLEKLRNRDPDITMVSEAI